MIEPKFALGERVAVCNSTITTVIPETVVLGREFRKFGFSVNQPGRLDTNFWAYWVAGHNIALGEWCLRPIDKDEYREESEQSKEVTL
jgi:hypothetical protein